MDAQDLIHSDDSPTEIMPAVHTGHGRWLRTLALPMAAIAIIGAAGSGSVSKALFPVTVMPAVHVEAGETQGPAPLASFDDVEVSELAQPAAAIVKPIIAPVAEPIIDLFPDQHTRVGDLVERNGITYRVDDVILMEVTAYCPCTKCCGPLAQGVTASGKPVTYNQSRFVAADIRVLPFDSEIRIPGYHGTSGEIVEVIDRGGAIKGNKLDVYFPDHQTALKWGRQTLPVQVLERVELE